MAIFGHFCILYAFGLSNFRVRLLFLVGQFRFILGRFWAVFVQKSAPGQFLGSSWLWEVFGFGQFFSGAVFGRFLALGCFWAKVSFELELTLSTICFLFGAIPIVESRVIAI